MAPVTTMIVIPAKKLAANCAAGQLGRLMIRPVTTYATRHRTPPKYNAPVSGQRARAMPQIIPKPGDSPRDGFEYLGDLAHGVGEEGAGGWRLCDRKSHIAFITIGMDPQLPKDLQQDLGPNPPLFDLSSCVAT